MKNPDVISGFFVFCGMGSPTPPIGGWTLGNFLKIFLRIWHLDLSC